jgi:methionyl-tRNA formyltransferase
MRVGFAGTPAFAAHILQALFDAEATIPIVLTRPDRPRGRGQKVAASPVKVLAGARTIPVLQTTTLATEAAQQAMLAHEVDVLVVAAYGLILPPPVLAWPRHGCINVHASLLPRWRGAAPIQRALLAGDAETGITLMQMDTGLDTGPMLDVAHLPVDARETAGSLEWKLAALGARMVTVYLRRLAAGKPGASRPQPAEGATYAAKIRKDEADIDWTASAVAIDRQVRAFDPAPGAVTLWAGQHVKLWRAQPGASPARAAAPGTVLAHDGAGIVVACGDGTLAIAELQPAGGRRMSAAAFAAGRGLTPGACFGAPAG